MNPHEEFLKQVHCFEKAAGDPEIQARLEADPSLREAFEAQRRAVRLIQLKRFETQSADSATRIRAGVLRTLRSSGVQTEAQAPGWWSGFKLAAAAAVLVLMALPFFLKPGGEIQPVTSFSASETDTELAGESPSPNLSADTFLVASNRTPSNQLSPVQMAPVNFDLP